MQAAKPVRHSVYTGSTDADGYTGTATFAAAVERLVFGWQPETLDTTVGEDYAKRVTDRIEVLVPSVTDYSPLDVVEFPPYADVPPSSGTIPANAYRVDQIRDYSNGPFGFQPGGVVVVERVSG